MKKVELRNLIILFQKNSMITLSWGIQNITQSDNGIRFTVNGRKYRGEISVKIVGDFCKVETMKDMRLAKLSNLVDVIDCLVEADEVQIRNLSKLYKK